MSKPLFSDIRARVEDVVRFRDSFENIDSCHAASWQARIDFLKLLEAIDVMGEALAYTITDDTPVFSKRRGINALERVRALSEGDNNAG